MNPIVTVEAYRLHNANCELTDAELEKVLDVAQQTVNTAVFGRLVGYPYFDENIKVGVIKAIKAQADYIVTNFGADMSESTPQSATIGSFSYSNGSTDSSDAAGSSPASLDLVAMTYLRTTGLLYRGGICAV